MGLEKLGRLMDTSIDREEIFRRYGYTCIFCISNRATVIHHIVPKSHKRKTADDESNLAPICVSCHYDLHRHGWKKSVDILKERLITRRVQE